jgi:hypothetical protein
VVACILAAPLRFEFCTDGERTARHRLFDDGAA